MSKTPYFVGIEAVGLRNVVGVLADARGAVLAVRQQAPGLSLYTTPKGTTAPRLLQLVLELLVAVELIADECCLTVCIGMSGVNSKFDADVSLTYELQKHALLRDATLIVTGDAEICFVGACQETTGHICFSGAGSVVASLTDGVSLRHGGWGPAFTDEGSAYQIGRDTLRAVVRWYDCNKRGVMLERSEEYGVLWRLVDQWMQYPGDSPDYLLTYDTGRSPAWADVAAEWRTVRRLYLVNGDIENLPEALVAFSYRIARVDTPSWWNFVASLSIPLLRYWKSEGASGTICDGIVQECVAKTCDAMKLAMESGATDSPIVLGGGLLNHNEDLRLRITDRLGIADRLVSIRTRTAMRPAIGALLLALAQCDVDRFTLPDTELIENVRRELGKVKWQSELKYD